MSHTVYTIGHSTRSAAEFIALLRDWRVELLCDVRRFPGSRRHPHFGADALAGALRGAGIEYRHEEALGGRRTPAADRANAYWRNRGFRGYAEHMASAEFMAALERVEAEFAQRTVALMCAEAVHWRCHRNLLSDALSLRGAEVRHIRDSENAPSHRVTESARLSDAGIVHYLVSDSAAQRDLGL